MMKAICIANDYSKEYLKKFVIYSYEYLFTGEFSKQKYFRIQTEKHERIVILEKELKENFLPVEE